MRQASELTALPQCLGASVGVVHDPVQGSCPQPCQRRQLRIADGSEAPGWAHSLPAVVHPGLEAGRGGGEGVEHPLRGHAVGHGFQQGGVVQVAWRYAGLNARDVAGELRGSHLTVQVLGGQGEPQPSSVGTVVAATGVQHDH
jgi:hypothetical protein